jgi:TonB family protein
MQEAISQGVSSPQAQRRVVALTIDPALSRALEELATLNVAVVQVPALEALAEQLVNGDSAIALIDAGAIDRQLDVLVDRLTTQFPDLRIIVAGHSLEQNLLATRIAQGTVFRFLHKPASAQRLKLFVDAANRPADSHRPVVALVSEPQREKALRASVAANGPEGPRRGPGGLPLPVLIGAGVAVVAVAASVLLFMGGEDSPAPATATTPTTTAPGTPAAAEVEALIRSADQAFAAQRFAGRDGTSAAELYQRALQAAPQDARARSGLTRSVDFAIRNAETAFTESRYAEVDSAVAALQVLAPGNSRLAFLSTQLQRERERSAADENRRLSSEARQEKLRTTLQQANDRLRRGALIEPTRDSALDLLATAQDLAPGDSDVRALRDRLGGRLIESATQKLESGDVPAARALLDAAGNLGADGAAVTRLRRRADELTTAPAAPRATPAATAPAASVPTQTPAAASPPPSGQAAGPAPGAAAPPVASAPRAADTIRIYSSSELTIVKRQEPEFPKRALETGTAGWVDVEFTIETDGSVKSIMVLNSQPGNLYVGSAQQALRRWRYKPVMENGVAVQARTRMRLRFTPQDE